MASSPLIISPRKLRSDLYSYSYQNDANTPLVISVLASLIERTMTRNERIAKNCKWALTKDFRSRVFDCHETPDMTIQSYLERIFRYTKAGPSVYVVAYVYIDRFCQANPGFRINARNVHRLLITTIMVASKYVEDMWVLFLFLMFKNLKREKNQTFYTHDFTWKYVLNILTVWVIFPEQELQEFVLCKSGRIDNKRIE